MSEFKGLYTEISALTTIVVYGPSQLLKPLVGFFAKVDHALLTFFPSTTCSEVSGIPVKSSAVPKTENCSIPCHAPAVGLISVLGNSPKNRYRHALTP